MLQRRLTRSKNCVGRVPVHRPIPDLLPCAVVAAVAAALADRDEHPPDVPAGLEPRTDRGPGMTSSPRAGRCGRGSASASLSPTDGG